MQNPKVKHAIKDVLIVIVGVISVWLVLQAIFGTPNPFYVVSSGSMEPVLDIYDVLIVKNGSTFEGAQRGDIIVFNRPEIHDRVIVHRIVDIRESSERIITTKGDANPASIPGTDFPITKDDYIGKVVYVIPKIGYVTRLIQPPVNYIIIAVILAILFFNRTSRKKDRKHDEDLSLGADNLSGTEPKDTTELPDTYPRDDINIEELKDTKLPETFPEDYIKREEGSNDDPSDRSKESEEK
jgi:signal peptidase